MGGFETKMDHSLFYQLTGILLVAGLIALIISLLKQPSIIAFILTGILIGGIGYAQVRSLPVFSDLGEIGVTLLLFMVGLELDVRRLREVGKVVLYTALGHMIFASVIAFFLARILHFDLVASVYIAIALIFASTIVMVKVLGEKGQLQTLQARIAVGVSIVEDFAALIILLFISSPSANVSLLNSLPLWQTVIVTLVRALIFFLALAFFAKKILPWLLKYLSRSDELLLSFSLGWALGLAALASLPIIGFNFAIGGFLAGLALANSEVHWEIAARIKSIRDFFIIIFFIVFGSQLSLNNLGSQISAVLIFFLFMMIINPLTVLLLLGWQGYKPKTAFLVSLTTSPMSEFSFIVVALGFKAGQLSSEVLSIVTIVGLTSIAVSSYSIGSGERLYAWLRPYLARFDWRVSGVERDVEKKLKNHIILVGVHRLGQHLISVLRKLPGEIVIVDINPEVVSQYLAAGMNAVCGDVTESYIQEQINLPQARVIISTIPRLEDNLALLEAVKRKTANLKYKPKLIFAAQNESEAKKLYESEIDYALSPHFIGGQHLAKILGDKKFNLSLKKMREHHLDILLDRNRS